ncbi:MAG: hypothetical protein RR971_02930, partial [Alistipes sp.]
MTPNDIRNILRQFSSLVDGWVASGNIAPIERDLALDKLKALYEALLLADVHSDIVEQVEAENINLDEMLSVDVANFGRKFD